MLYFTRLFSFVFRFHLSVFFFFFTDTATTDIYTLSLHDALPLSPRPLRPSWRRAPATPPVAPPVPPPDRKSTRLNSSHVKNTYAVFCLKKKKNTKKNDNQANVKCNR